MSRIQHRAAREASLTIPDVWYRQLRHGDAADVLAVALLADLVRCAGRRRDWVRCSSPSFPLGISRSRFLAALRRLEKMSLVDVDPGLAPECLRDGRIRKGGSTEKPVRAGGESPRR